MCKATLSLLADNKYDCFQAPNLVAARRKLRKVFKDISRRSLYPKLGVDLLTFLKCTGLTGLLGEQFFRALDEDQDGQLSLQEFLDGFVTLYCGNAEERTFILFDVLDFGHKGFLTPKGLKIFNRYFPTACPKCGAKLIRSWDFYSELEMLFSENKVLSCEQVQGLVFSRPAFFELLLQTLLMALPPVFEETFGCQSDTCRRPEPRRLVALKLDERRFFGEIQDQALYLYAGVNRNSLKRILVLRGLFIEPKNAQQFALKSGEFSYEFEAFTETDRDEIVEAILEATHYRWFDDYYETGEVIGEGASGRVLKAVHRVTGTVAAVKIVNKDHSQRSLEAHIRREIDVLRLARHENLLELYDVFETNERLYIVTEFVTGGTLFDWLQQRGFKTSEETAKGFVKDLASGLRFLHKLGVVHRDIKLENVMLVSQGKQLRAKLIDFGLATFLGPGDTSQEPVGTLKYVSPEVISRLHYREKADNWSLGVILYIMLRGTVPFYGKTEEETALRILKKSLHLRTEAWQLVSEPAKFVLERLLTRRPDYRMSLKELLSSVWLSDDISTQASMQL